jgi:murein DD-endopeptidase MepM/ murein hydrolase activator NlpD
MLPQFRLSLKKLLFSMFVLLVLPAAVAYAGFFSMFGDIFSKINTVQKPITSQNIALLAAASAPDLGSRSQQIEVNTVGGSALLPDAGPEGAIADLSDEDFDHGQISIYTVHEGDSLASIAKMFDVSVNTILWANNMQKGAKLAIGETLVILPVSGVEYVVKKGDTIESIAKKYKGDPLEVRSYNGFAESEQPSIGAMVIIPDGEMPTVVPVKTKPASSKLRGASGPELTGFYHSPLASYRKSQGLHGYNGVDLVEYIGAPVFAAADGDVVVARQGGYNGGYGNYVVIRHANGTQTLYGHLQSITVSAGGHVSQGETIGYLGNTGRSTGPHLHFEVRGAKNPF